MTPIRGGVMGQKGDAMYPGAFNGELFLRLLICSPLYLCRFYCSIP